MHNWRGFAHRTSRPPMYRNGKKYGPRVAWTRPKMGPIVSRYTYALLTRSRIMVFWDWVQTSRTFSCVPASGAAAAGQSSQCLPAGPSPPGEHAYLTSNAPGNVDKNGSVQVFKNWRSEFVQWSESWDSSLSLGRDDVHLHSSAHFATGDNISNSVPRGSWGNDKSFGTASISGTYVLVLQFFASQLYRFCT